jgi:TolA-binding protein
LPESLRAGPYYVLGLGLAAHDQHRRAAVALMRIPILFPRQEALAAEALLAAGRSLAGLDQIDEAARVYRELIAQHSTSTAAAEARQRLESLEEAR